MNWFRNRTAPLLAGAALFAAASIPFAVSPVMANGHSSARAAAKMVKTSKAKILLNAKGQTLYVFAPDPKGKSTCYDTCAKFWPPVLVPSGTTVAAKQNKLPGTFGTAARTDGTQ